MEKKLKFLNDYFALINMKAFCEKYGISYDQVRHVLKGDKPMSGKFFNNMLEVFRVYESDQLRLKDEFYNGVED